MGAINYISNKYIKLKYIKINCIYNNCYPYFPSSFELDILLPYNDDILYYRPIILNRELDVKIYLFKKELRHKNYSNKFIISNY